MSPTYFSCITRPFTVAGLALTLSFVAGCGDEVDETPAAPAAVDSHDHEDHEGHDKDEADHTDHDRHGAAGSPRTAIARSDQ